MRLRFLKDHGFWREGQVVEIYAEIKDLIDLKIAEPEDKIHQKRGRPVGSKNKPKNKRMKKSKINIKD